MGWWKINDVERGQSAKMHRSETETDLYNGDGPADEMGECLDSIAREYMAAFGRWPKLDELQACFNFVTNPRKEGDTYVPWRKR
jgi:hypothetical protein